MYIDPEQSVQTEMKHRVERLPVLGEDRRAGAVTSPRLRRRRGTRR